MIKFKTLKYKHYKQAQAINKKIDAGQADDDEILSYTISLVEAWDFKDAETGELLPISDEAMGELSLEQYNQLMGAFNGRMGENQEVPKASAESSPST